MAFVIATGTSSNDVVRKETRNGVLTTFRLETGETTHPVKLANASWSPRMTSI